ncbi:MAG: hypothetical protein IEMM0006_0344 [bacterium]|nr:MAG: hypothetical protein IEMM0006_0344 [bacterium]
MVTDIIEKQNDVKQNSMVDTCDSFSFEVI